MKDKRVYSSAIALSIAMITSISTTLPTATVQAFSESSEEEVIYEHYADIGECGESASYYLDENGVLIIRGEGEITSNEALYNHYNDVHSIVIEYGITSIGDSAFLNYNKVETVSIASSVKSIGNSAFYWVSSMKEITIPESVESIGEMAFYGCSELEKVVILNPDCDLADADSTISGFYDDKTGTNPYYGTIKGYIGSTAEKYAEKYNKPFADLDKTSPEIIKSGKCGDNSSFTLDTSGLLTINGKGDLDNIANGMFVNITNNKVKRAVFENGITDIGMCVFQNCTALESVNLPNTIKTIPDFAFENCIGLTEITIPDSVEGIGSSAFKGCSSLSSINIPTSVKRIDELAFESTSWLREKQSKSPFVIINDILINGQAVTENDVIIPDGVKTIGSYAFLSTGITSVTIPNSVTDIEYAAFGDCKSLSVVDIPDSVTYLGGDIFDGTAFLNNKQKQNPMLVINGMLVDASACSGNVTVPEGITKICDFAFDSCEELTSVTLPDTLTDIGECAFAWSENLSTVNFGNSITEIGDSAFYSCKSLVSIDIPESVEVINEGAFQWCSSLESIVLPNNVKEVKKYVLANCEKLDSVTILNPSCVFDEEGSSICQGTDFIDGKTKFIFSGKLIGDKGSTTEEYAQKQGYTFIALNGETTAYKFGDPNNDGKIDANDASFILVEYSKLSTGAESKLSENEKTAADVNSDGKIDSKDASVILSYYSFLSTGGDKELVSFIKQNNK